FLVDAERALEVEIAFRLDAPALHFDADRGRYRAQRDAGARYERLEQHVARTEFMPRAAGRRMQARDGNRAPRLDLAGNAFVQRALRFECDDCGVRVLTIAVLERRLQFAQRVCVHDVLAPEFGGFYVR